jgi:hypothetical protein
MSRRATHAHAETPDYQPTVTVSRKSGFRRRLFAIAFDRAIRRRSMGVFSAMALDAGDHEKTFRWDDQLDLESRLPEDERMIARSARSHGRERLPPRVVGAVAEERFDRAIMTEMGALGLEGAHDLNPLILGGAITGENAF